MKTIAHPYQLLMLALFGMSFPVNGAAADDAAAMHSHHHMTEPKKYQTADYTLPEIRLVRDDGTNVSLIEELNDGRPVVLNFIYTTCTTICPLASHTFAELQDRLGSERGKVHMVSISIDPEQDTPAVLAKYARKYGADSQWRFYTGTKEASITAQRAFNIYLGDKMNSDPVTFIRVAPDQPWLRIDGFATSDELYRLLRDKGASAGAQRRAEDH